jgi:hypothetical protein
LEIGSLSTLGLGMSDFLRAESIAKNSGRKLKEKSVIFVWLPGGMSQLESYDMKPNAPVEYRGVLNPHKGAGHADLRAFPAAGEADGQV